MTLGRIFTLVLVGCLLCGSMWAQDATDKAIGLYEEGKYEEAAAILEPAVEANKNDKLAWLFLGASLLKSGHDGAAVKAFRKGVTKTKTVMPGYETQLEITTKPFARFTEAARQNMTTGIVRIAVEFLPTVKIGFTHPVDGLPDGLTQQCIQAVRGIRFKPPQKNGRAVTTIRVIEYTFEIY